jgi:hypothetical protein
MNYSRSQVGFDRSFEPSGRAFLLRRNLLHTAYPIVQGPCLCADCYMVSKMSGAGFGMKGYIVAYYNKEHARTRVLIGSRHDDSPINSDRTLESCQ